MSQPDQPRPIGESLRQRAAEVAGRKIIPMTPPSIEAEVEAMWEERWHRGVPRRYWNATVEDLEPEAAEAAEEWTARRPLPNLIIVGPYGTGKTHMACAVVRPWHRAGARVQYASAPDLLDEMRPGAEGRVAFERATHVDILVLDDLAAVRDTEWTDEMLYRMIDARWRADRAIVATTNLDLTELAARVGPRVYERLCLSGAVLVQLGGESRRRKP